jgi:hypothetical protein
MVTLNLRTCGRTSSMDRVDMRTIEITLRNAVARGALDNYDVDAAMDGMWNALATFMESQRMPLGTLQEKSLRMAAALEEFNKASTEVIGLLNRAASS